VSGFVAGLGSDAQHAFVIRDRKTSECCRRLLTPLPLRRAQTDRTHRPCAKASAKTVFPLEKRPFSKCLVWVWVAHVKKW
jgi:hypothetical protein